MRLSKIVPIVLAILAVPECAFPQGGKAGLSFLKLGVGARSLAMGEAAVASADDPSATHYNPAALRLGSNPKLLIMHKEWILGSRTEFLAASFAVGSFSIGAFVNATSIPDIELRQRPGPPDGTFSARNAAIGASAAYSVGEKIGVGLSLKYLYEKIFVDEADGYGVDVGILYLSPFDVTLGLSLAHVGQMGTLRNEPSKLPTTLRVGAARQETLSSLDGALTLSADIVSVIPEKNTHVQVGAEFTYDQTFALRLGYVSGFETRNITAGAGVRYAFITVDYAFVPFRMDFGTTHTVSLVIDF